METIKSVLGLGGSVPPSDPEPGPAQKDLSGQEPISGKQGAGTATDPYDAGNADGAWFTNLDFIEVKRLTLDI